MPTLRFLAELVHRRSGLMLGEDKDYLLETRLAPIAEREGATSVLALARLLAAGSCTDLEQEVAEAMATNETQFFRDGKPFDHLRDIGLPALLRNRSPGARLRVWSAAASTGQEAYSIAMVAVETGLARTHRVEILGTDFARPFCERATAGHFTQYEVQRGLSTQRLMRHFVRDGDGWQIDRGLQALCRFQLWNLLTDPARLGRFDVVFCRNVLFYFDRPTRRRVLAGIMRQMVPDGLLYLGSTETAAGLTNALERRGASHSLLPARLAQS